MIDKVTFVLLIVCSAQFIGGTPAVSESHQLKKRQVEINNIAIDENGSNGDGATVNAPLAIANGALGGAAVATAAVADPAALLPLNSPLFLPNVAAALKPGGLSELDLFTLVFATTPPSTIVEPLIFLAPPDEPPAPLPLASVLTSLPPGNLIVLVLGPLLDINSSPVQAILDYYVSLPILIIAPDSYNLIEIADNIFGIAQILSDVFKNLPAPQNVTLIGVEVGAALLGAVMQLSFPLQASFQQIIVINPIVPALLFDITTFASALQVNTNPVVVINTIAGVLKLCSPFVNLDLVLFTNAIRIFVDPTDLLLYCAPASINVVTCMLAFGVKVAIDALSGSAIVVALGETAAFPLFAAAALNGGQGLTASIIKPISAYQASVYYYIPVDVYKNGYTLAGLDIKAVTGIDTAIAGVINSGFSATDILATTYMVVFSNVFGTRFISMQLNGAQYAITILVCGQQLVVDASITLDVFIATLTQTLIKIVGNFNTELILPMATFIFNTYVTAAIDPLVAVIPPSNPGSLAGALSASSSSSLNVNSNSSSGSSGSLLDGLGGIVTDLGDSLGLGSVLGPVGGLVTGLDDQVGDILSGVAGGSDSSATDLSGTLDTVTGTVGSLTGTVGGLTSGLGLDGLTDAVGGLTGGLGL